MKDNNMSRAEVVQVFNKMVEDAWKELNEELLIKASPKDDDLPRPVLLRILDGYTYSEKLIKDDIITTYLKVIPI